MNKIKILDESISNIIAAGEVVENPASMIKELIENSLDAGSTKITLDVKNSGRDLIISDNGHGMSREDLYLSIERHATSKIGSKEDIFNLNTYGFRGEALASITAVAKVGITSKRDEDQSGSYIYVVGGKIRTQKDLPTATGTKIEISSLFYNTPARLKFLRGKGTEYGKIKDIVLKEALYNSNVSFTLTLDGREVIRTSGHNMENTILELFGRKILKNLEKFPLGYLGNLEVTRSSKDYIYTFINGRYVRSNILDKAILDGYYTLLTKGRYPIVILFLDIDPSEVDVNVHPSKKVVKFSNNSIVYDKVYNSVKSSLEELNERITSPILEGNLVEDSDTKESGSKIDLSEFSDILGEDLIKEEKPIEPKNDIGSKRIVEEVKEEDIKESIKEDPRGEQSDTKGRSYSIDNLSGPKKEEKLEIKPTFNSYKKELLKPKVSDSKLPEYEVTPLRLIEEDLIKREKKVEVRSKPREKSYDFKVIGQLSRSYIIVERNDTLEIYDQHIVHERALYEKLRDEYRDKKISKQGMLVPIAINLGYKELELVRESKDILEEFGFEVDEGQGGDILIRSAPIFDFRSSISETFKYILENIEKNKATQDVREKILISMSCRNAVKAGEELSVEEMYKLIDDLHKIGKYTCPHGRPIILKFPMIELEKKFKRR